MTLRAGAAAGEISPALPAALFGYPHVERIAVGVHDPLLASVLYLHDTAGAAVLIALDLLLLDLPTAMAIRRRVARRLSIAESRVFLSCTHTHSGPVTARLLAWSDDPTIPPPDQGYLQLLSTRIEETAQLAAERAVPAEIAWTAADARGVGGNRHAADGVTDPQAGVLAVRAAGGTPIAVAVIYGMHPTVLHEDSRLVSSDFPHYLRCHLKERWGEELTVLYQMGPSGNQSPRHFVARQTFAEAERLGRRLGASVAASVGRIDDAQYRRQVELQGQLAPVELTRRILPTVAVAESILAQCRNQYEQLLRGGADKAQIRTAECAVFGAEGTLTLARLQARGVIDQKLRDYRPIEVQVLRVGDGSLVGLPGELFAEYGLAIRQRTAGRAYVATLVGGDLQGYITTPAAAVEGCYESLTTLFAPESGEMLVATALRLLGNR